MSIKPRKQSNKPIRTVRDARLEKLYADETRRINSLRKELTQKARHWEQRVAQYGGEVQKATLAKFQAQLAAIN